MVNDGEVKISITTKGYLITKIEIENNRGKTFENYENGLPALQICRIPIMVEDVGIINFIADFSGRNRKGTRRGGRYEAR